MFKRLYSRTNFIGLEAIPSKFNITNSTIDISIRPFEASDINALNEEFRHARLVEEQIPNCYVATTKEDDVTVYRQWVFTHKHKQKVIDFFGPIFPEINKDEAIIEGVFTHPDYRGIRVMSNAMSKIIQQKQYKNLQKVIAFVEETNIASLKGFYRIGFIPYMIRKETWCLFRRKVSLEQMPSKYQKRLLKTIA